MMNIHNRDIGQLKMEVVKPNERNIELMGFADDMLLTSSITILSITILTPGCTTLLYVALHCTRRSYVCKPLQQMCLVFLSAVAFDGLKIYDITLYDTSGIQ